MASIFTTTAIGNVGRDAELREVGDTKVLSFSIAIDQGYKKASGERVEKTEWVNVSVWGKFGVALAPHIKKGNPIAVTGVISARGWQSKTTGDINASLELKASEVQLLGGKSSGGNTAPQAEEPYSDSIYSSAPAGGMDDIPF